MFALHRLGDDVALETTFEDVCLPVGQDVCIDHGDIRPRPFTSSRLRPACCLLSSYFVILELLVVTYRTSRGPSKLPWTLSSQVNDLYTHCSKGSLRTTPTRSARLARRRSSTHHMCARNADNCPLQSAGRNNHRNHRPTDQERCRRTSAHLLPSPTTFYSTVHVTR